MKEELKQTITQLGLDYRLMTQFTSFVAVEEMVVTDGGQPRRIDVPVEVPEGVNREAVISEQHASFATTGRQVQSLPLLSRGALNQTVTVSGSVSAINPGSVATENRAPRPKLKLSVAPLTVAAAEGLATVSVVLVLAQAR